MEKSLTEVAQTIRRATMVAIDNIDEEKVGFEDSEYRTLQEEALYEYIALLTGGKMTLPICDALDTIIKEIKVIADDSERNHF